MLASESIYEETMAPLVDSDSDDSDTDTTSLPSLEDELSSSSSDEDTERNCAPPRVQMVTTHRVVKQKAAGDDVQKAILKTEREFRRQDQKRLKKQLQEKRENEHFLSLIELYMTNYARGVVQYVRGDFGAASASFQMVKSCCARLSSLSPESVPKEISSNDFIFRYLWASSLLKSDSLGVRGDQVVDEFQKLTQHFPSQACAFWMYGRALNRYHPRSNETETILLQAAKLCTNSNMERIYLTADCVLTESDVDVLSGLIEVELELVRKRPPPDALCAYVKCTKNEIYFNTGDAWLTRIRCTSEHTDFYHKGCWRRLARTLLGGHNVLGSACLQTGGCSGVVTEYEVLNGQGLVRKMLTTLEKVDRKKETDHDNEVDEGTKEEENARNTDTDTENLHPEHASDALYAPLPGDLSADQPVSPENPNDSTETLSQNRHVSAFAVDVSQATVIMPRATHIATITSKTKKSRSKVKGKPPTMTLSEFWKSEEVKAAAREEELEALRKTHPVLDLQETLKVLKRRPTKKFVRK